MSSPVAQYVFMSWSWGQSSEGQDYEILLGREFVVLDD